MEYIYKENQISLDYQKIYVQAREKNEQIKCFIGVEREYRMNSRESYYDNITDTDILLEYCLYPLFSKEDGNIISEIDSIIEQMINSNDVVQIFQIFNLIMSQEIEMRLYAKLPFIIDFSNILDKLLEKKNKMKHEIKEYRDYGFDRFGESIWDVIERICRKSQIIQDRLNR